MSSIRLLKRNISTKVLLGIVTLTVFSLASFVVSNSALDTTKEIHERLIQKALPLLTGSEKLAASISYLQSIATDLSNKKSFEDVKDSKIAVVRGTSRVKDSLRKFFYLLPAQDEKVTKSLEQPLKKIVDNTQELSQLVLDKRPGLLKEFLEEKISLDRSLGDAIRRIRRYKISSGYSPSLVELDVVEDLGILKGYVGKLDEDLSTKEVAKIKLEYSDAIRGLTRDSLLIKDSTLKQVTADYLDSYLAAATSENGVISGALRLAENRKQSFEIVNANKKNEQLLHQQLAELLETTSFQTSEDIASVDLEIEEFSLYLLLILISSLLCSIVLVFLVSEKTASLGR